MPVVPLSTGLSTNELYPGDIEQFHDRVRAAVAEQTTAQGKARAEGRRQKKFPKARDYSWPAPQRDESFKTTVSQHLGRYALHLMYADERPDRRLTLQELVEHRSIAERLESHVWAVGAADV